MAMQLSFRSRASQTPRVQLDRSSRASPRLDRRPPAAPSGRCDRVICEDLLDPLEGFVDGILRFRPLLHDLGPRGLPHVLALDLRYSRVEDPEIRHGQADQASIYISHHV